MCAVCLKKFEEVDELHLKVPKPEHVLEKPDIASVRLYRDLRISWDRYFSHLAVTAHDHKADKKINAQS